jgi:hypothetical protein
MTFIPFVVKGALDPQTAPRRPRGKTTLPTLVALPPRADWGSVLSAPFTMKLGKGWAPAEVVG